MLVRWIHVRMLVVAGWASLSLDWRNSTKALSSHWVWASDPILLNSLLIWILILIYYLLIVTIGPWTQPCHPHDVACWVKATFVILSPSLIITELLLLTKTSSTQWSEKTVIILLRLTRVVIIISIFWHQCRQTLNLKEWWSLCSSLRFFTLISGSFWISDFKAFIMKKIVVFWETTTSTIPLNVSVYGVDLEVVSLSFWCWVLLIFWTTIDRIWTCNVIWRNYWFFNLIDFRFHINMGILSLKIDLSRWIESDMILNNSRTHSSTFRTYLLQSVFLLKSELWRALRSDQSIKIKFASPSVKLLWHLFDYCFDFLIRIKKLIGLIYSID